MSGELVRKLSYRYPFVYKVGEQYFYIGSTVFRKCTQEEIEKHKCYIAEHSKLEKEDKYNLPRTAITFVQAIEDLINIGNSEYDCRNAGQARHNLEITLEGLDESTLEAFCKQVNDFENAIELRDRYQIKYFANSSNP